MNQQEIIAILQENNQMLKQLGQIIQNSLNSDATQNNITGKDTDSIISEEALRQQAINRLKQQAGAA